MNIPHVFRTRRFLVGVVVFSLTSMGVCQPIGEQGPVHIDSGLVSGIAGDDDSITVYKGIPFAAAPAGDLRWRAPQPVESWDGVRDTSEFCDSCMQALRRSYLPWTEEYMLRNDVDEDCLAVNVWTPAESADEKLPVYVFIHGGAYSSGSGEVELYDGEGLAKKGIIVVTINYRLGVFGFLAHPELTAESPNGSSGNYGLLDQIAGLEWVKRNIEAFGGDPDNVTLGGQSAGAGSVHFLTASPLAKGLFNRVITQSGPWRRGNKTPGLSDGEEVGVNFGETVGATSLEKLRGLSADELYKLYTDNNFRFRPIVDGWVVANQVSEVFARGEQIDVPMLAGFTADEGSSRGGYNEGTRDSLKSYIDRRYGDLAEAVSGLYPAASDEAAVEVRKQLSRDESLANLYDWTNARAEKGSAKDYSYYFERAIPWPEHPEYQVFHSGELPYVFNNLGRMDRPWTAIDKRVAEQMSSYWVNFITTGNPNGKGLPKWPENNAKVMRIGEDTRAENILSEEKLAAFEQAAGR